MTDSLVINEIYLSVQGESSWAGWPCVFVRTTGCDLRCSYCDTTYAFTEGERQTLDSVVSEIEKLAEPFRKTPPKPSAIRTPLVELTGGEPLLQRNTPALIERLLQAGYTTLIETSGAHDISKVSGRAHRIVDLKVPSSGESGRMHWANIEHLTPTDEVKFVIATDEDYVWARDTVRNYNLTERCQALFSLAEALAPEQRVSSLKPEPDPSQRLTRGDVVERMLNDGISARFQLQAHKFIWPPTERGV